MRAQTSLSIALVSLLVASAVASAQEREPGPSTSDILHAVLHPSWSMFLTAGAGSHGRFLLQQMPFPDLDQRSVRANDTFSVGTGFGLDFLPRSGARISYTFSSSDLTFRSDNGDDSRDLDIDDGGTLHNHVAAIELLRYMFPARTGISPYGSAGLLATWWVLDGESTVAASPGGDNMLFRFGALATFGVQMQFSGHTAGRIEWSSSSIRNPFTGRESFVAPGATTIDEPTRVTQSDVRFTAVYYFSRPTDPRVPATASRRN